jgi:hypothetical protein
MCAATATARRNVRRHRHRPVKCAPPPPPPREMCATTATPRINAYKISMRLLWFSKNKNLYAFTVNAYEEKETHTQKNAYRQTHMDSKRI